MLAALLVASAALFVVMTNNPSNAPSTKAEFRKQFQVIADRSYDRMKKAAVKAGASTVETKTVEAQANAMNKTADEFAALNAPRPAKKSMGHLVRGLRDMATIELAALEQLEATKSLKERNTFLLTLSRDPKFIAANARYSTALAVLAEKGYVDSAMFSRRPNGNF